VNTKWQDFLKNMGAEYSGSQLSHFGNPDLERRACDNGLIIADLSHLSLIKAAGADTVSFLQGQLTNDIEQLTDNRSQLSGYCNPKGRLLASFRVFRKAEDLYLMLPEALYDSTFKRLKMYLMRSKVEFSNCSDHTVSIGISGPAADTELQKHLKDLPQKIDDVIHSGELSIIKLPGIQPRFQLTGPVDELIPLWQSLDVNAAPVGKAVWDLLEIRAGIPTIYPETVESFVPQMVNLELINGVSFKKGCYTGQEIVARMHYLGKLKRRMYRVHIDSSESIIPGTPLFSPTSSSGQGTGNIVVAAPASSGKGIEALAVIQTSESESSELRLNNAEGEAISILEIPYEFPAQKT